MTLKEIRLSKGLKQEEASKILNIPLRTYKRYENDSSYNSSFKYQSMISELSALKKQSTKKSTACNSLNIAVVGIGYVGLSLATLLSVNNNVVITDIIKDKIDKVNQRIAPFKDNEIEKYFANKKLNLTASISNEEIYKDKDIVIIAVPTDFDAQTNSFNVSNVDSTIALIYKANKKALIVIKSTVPIGYTESIINKYKDINIIFSPEFLKEGSALYDNLYPSRIIIGADCITNKVKTFASLLENEAKNLNKTIYMTSSEAEATKLFSNAYLAMRVAYFNELDSYAKTKGLSTKRIIEGMGRDSRIGDYYNNPSFGYGGYCLPKDSEQLQNSFIDISNNNLIKAIVDSNKTRKEYIANDLINEAMKKTNKSKEDIVVGIYKLAMKTNSDNYRSSSSLDVMNLLKEKGIKVIVYEPSYLNSEKDINEFKSHADIIIANRYSSVLNDVKEKIYTRDIYKRD